MTTSDGREWLWSGDATFWSGRSPVLFPIVGKAPGDHLTIDGTRYAMNQHGFARRSEFMIDGIERDFCRLSLTASDATRAVYPFEFRLALEYRVEGRRLSVFAEVANDDRRPMVFGIGFHPAFAYPLPGAENTTHEVWLENGAEPELVRLDGGLRRPERLASPFLEGAWPVDHHMFEADAMIFPEGAGTAMRYGVSNGPQVALTCDDLPNFALWSKPGAGFLCLEPWHGTAPEVGASDAMEQRPYANVLDPGAQRRFGFHAELIG